MVLQQTRAPCNKIMKYRKFFCFLLACSVLSTAVPATAFARTNSTQAVETEDYSNQDGKKECQIEAEMASDFAVTVPKRITLDGESKSGSYTVGCTGDIAGNETVSVQPSVTFPMEQTGKSAVDAEVTQAKTVFRSKGYNSELSGMEARIGTDNLNGSIAADGLSAGVWNGNLTFTIALNEEEIIGNDLPLTSDNLALLKDLNGQPIATEGDVVIPEYVKTPDGEKHRVTAIGKNAFSGKEITSVSIPDSVTTIGTEAFFKCKKLTEVSGCRGLKNIGREAFMNDSCLETVGLHEGLETIGQSAFTGCEQLAKILIPSTVTNLGSYSFERCNITSVTIPDGITNIGDYTFSGCKNFVSVKIGAGVKTIGMYAFSFCSKLEQIDIPDNVENIGECAFYRCDRLKTVNIGAGVKNIGISAFAYDTNLETLTIKSAANIGEFAFSSCEKLTEVKLPDNTKSIERYAFAYDLALQSINIPANVTGVGANAFNGDKKLHSVNFANTSGWKAGDTAINSSDIADPATAATYLKTNYMNSTWVRSDN